MKTRDQLDNETIMLGVLTGLIGLDHHRRIAIEDVVVQGDDPYLVIRCNGVLKSAYRVRVELIPDTDVDEPTNPSTWD